MQKPSVAARTICRRPRVKNKKGRIYGGRRLPHFMVRGALLVELAEAAAYGEQYKKWSYDSLPPILPQPWQYTVFNDRQKQFKI